MYLDTAGSQEMLPVNFQSSCSSGQCGIIFRSADWSPDGVLI